MYKEKLKIHLDLELSKCINLRSTFEGYKHKTAAWA